MLVGSDGEVRSVAFGQALHPHEFGHEENYASLRDLINQLVRNASHPPISESNCRRICIVCPGIQSDIEKLPLLRILTLDPWLGVEPLVLSDGPATLIAGSLRSHGTAIVVGSGATVYARDETGCEKRTGGWGSIVGSEGSGYDIARWALGAIVKAHDGTDEDCPHLREAVMRRLHVESISDLLAWIYAQRGMRVTIKISGIAPAVVEAAELFHDLVAKRILDRAINQIISGYKAVHRHMDWNTTQHVAVLEGGVIENSRYFKSCLENDIRQADPAVTFTDANYRAVVAASFFALTGAVGIPSREKVSNMLSSLTSLPLEQQQYFIGPALNNK
jgi:N-acetylglucosamine kinase-like BadF-type ATPase